MYYTRDIAYDHEILAFERVILQPLMSHHEHEANLFLT
jgi:hypothetical protein